MDQSIKKLTELDLAFRSVETTRRFTDGHLSTFPLHLSFVQERLPTCQLHCFQYRRIYDHQRMRHGNAFDRIYLSVRLSVCLSVCPSVCLSLCLSVRLPVCNALTFESLDLGSSFLAYIFRGYMLYSYIKVIWSRSRSQKQKSTFAYPVRGWSAFDWKAILFTNKNHGISKTLAFVIQTSALIINNLHELHTIEQQLEKHSVTA